MPSLAFRKLSYTEVVETGESNTKPKHNTKGKDKSAPPSPPGEMSYAEVAETGNTAEDEGGSQAAVAPGDKSRGVLSAHG